MKYAGTAKMQFDLQEKDTGKGNFGDTAVLFAGQGAQLGGMGRELADRNRDAMELWRKAEKASGLNLRGIYWDGSDEEMADTRALQPALTVVNLNIWNNFKLRPSAAAGHSLGEFSAVAASGALGIEEILEIVSLRGSLMAAAKGGSMAAVVKLTASEVEAIVAETSAELQDIIVCANYNSPVQTVISGTAEAVRAAIGRAKLKKGRALLLPVSGGFHSPLMEEANREFIPRLKKADWRKPRFPVYNNVTGSASTTAEAIRNNLEKQMISSVLWVDTIKKMRQTGIDHFVEIGPKAVLGKLVGQITGDGCKVELAMQGSD